MHRILIPVDGSRDALHSVEAASRLWREGGVELHLLNVQPRMNRHIARFARAASIDAFRGERARGTLDAAKARVGSASVRSAFRTGVPHEAITAYAQEHGIDEIVMASARKSLLERFLTGSVVNEVIAASPVPVTVVAGRQPGVLERFGLPAGLGIGLAALVMGLD